MSRGLSLGRNALVFALSFFLSILVADLVLRLFFLTHFFHRPHEVLFQPQWPEMPLVPRYQANAVYDGDSFGDLASVLPDRGHRVHRRVRFQTDVHGFRNPAQASQKPVDLVLLGDSFTAGDGTTQDKIWSERLRRDGRNVYNMGVSGSPWHEYVNFQIMVKRLKFKPDARVVWALFPGNDLDETYWEDTDLSHMRWNGFWKQWRIRLAEHVSHSPVRQLLLRFWASRGPSSDKVIIVTRSGEPVLFYKDYLRSSALTKEQVLNYWSYPLLRNVMKNMKRDAEALGLKLDVVILPSKEEVDAADSSRSGIAEAILDLCAENGIECVDFKQDFVAQKETLYWPDDSHWNENGHALAARLTEKLLS